MLSGSTASPETLESFYAGLPALALAPLWTVQEEALVSEPVSQAAAHHWRWRDLRP